MVKKSLGTSAERLVNNDKDRTALVFSNTHATQTVTVYPTDNPENCITVPANSVVALSQGEGMETDRSWDGYASGAATGFNIYEGYKKQSIVLTERAEKPHPAPKDPPM